MGELTATLAYQRFASGSRRGAVPEVSRAREIEIVFCDLELTGSVFFTREGSGGVGGTSGTSPWAVATGRKVCFLI